MILLYSIVNGILLLVYFMLSSGKFISLLEIMHLVLSHQNELITYYQQTNHIHLQILYLKHFFISQTLLCWSKILVSSAYRYAWLFGRTCGIYFFIYNKNNSDPNTDSWGTLQFMVPVFENTSNEMKKALCLKYEWNRQLHYLYNKYAESLGFQSDVVRAPVTEIFFLLFHLAV